MGGAGQALCQGHLPRFRKAMTAGEERAASQAIIADGDAAAASVASEDAGAVWAEAVSEAKTEEEGEPGDAEEDEVDLSSRSRATAAGAVARLRTCSVPHRTGARLPRRVLRQASEPLILEMLGDLHRRLPWPTMQELGAHRQLVQGRLVR